MRYLAQRVLVLGLLTVALGACGSVQPHGALKDVVEGKIFERTPPNPAEEKKKEETRRELEKQIPPPKEDPAAVQFRIPL